MKTYKNFETLLNDMKNDMKIENGLIDYNFKSYHFEKGNEIITLSQYNRSEDLILVQTDNSTFTISKWDDTHNELEQIELIINQ
jgi:hypothetical protein